MARAATLAPGGGYAEVMERLGRVLSAAEIGACCGVSARQAQNWRAGGHRPREPARRRLLDLAAIVRDLEDVYTPEGVQIFLHGRQRELGGRRPLEVIVGGDAEAVALLVERLRAGAM